MWGVITDPPQPKVKPMENLISLLLDNPDAPIVIVLLVWIITQVNKIKAQIAIIQNDIDRFLRAIIITKLTKHEGTNNRHQDKGH